MTTRKTIALTKWTFVGTVMFLLFYRLSRLVITFLPRSKRLLISWLKSPYAVLVYTILVVKLHFVFQRTPRTDLLQNGLVGSPCSSTDSQESSPTPQIKSINSLVLSFL